MQIICNSFYNIFQIRRIQEYININLHGSSRKVCFFLWRCDPTRVMASLFLRFLDHTQRRSTVGRTPLDEWSARRRDLYLTTQNTHNRQTSMPPVGFEPTISAGERPQTYALDRAGTGTGSYLLVAVWNVAILTICRYPPSVLSKSVYYLRILKEHNNHCDHMWSSYVIVKVLLLFVNWPIKTLVRLLAMWA